MKGFCALPLFLGLLLGVSEVIAQNCHMREIDLCAATVFVYTRDPKNAIPVTEEGIDKQCVQLRESFECVRNFTSRCATPVQREAFRFFVRGPNELLDSYCQKGSDIRTRFLKHAPCLREAAMSKEIRSCVSDVQATLDTITDVPEDPFSVACWTSNPIPDLLSVYAGKTLDEYGTPTFVVSPRGTVTAYTRFRQCAETYVESKCGKDAIDLENIALRMGASNIAERVCSCMDPTSSQCTKVLPPPGTKPQGTKSSSPIARLVATFLPVP